MLGNGPAWFLAQGAIHVPLATASARRLADAQSFTPHPRGLRPGRGQVGSVLSQIPRPAHGGGNPYLSRPSRPATARLAESVQPSPLCPEILLSSDSRPGLG